MMKTSDAGRKAIMQREGVILKAYRDSVGVLTIGCGHTSGAGVPHVTPGMCISRQECDAILSRDLEMFERAVNDAVKVPLNQEQFDALMSLCFNIGAAGFKRSTVVRRLNEKNYRGAADAFLLWNKPPELIGRRKAERAQFLSGAGVFTPGKPVRYIPKPDLHEGEQVNLDYMRASDSRIVKHSDTIQNSLRAATGAAATAGAIASGVSGIHDSAQAVGHAASDTNEMLGWLETYWPYIALAVLTVILIVTFYRIWVASEEVQTARLQDAVYEPDQVGDA